MNKKQKEKFDDIATVAGEKFVQRLNEAVKRHQPTSQHVADTLAAGPEVSGGVDVEPGDVSTWKTMYEEKCKELDEFRNARGPTSWTLSLDRYQRDNLLWLLLIIWDGNFSSLNTGDWVGEIPYKLVPPGDEPRLTSGDMPNCTLEQWKSNDTRFGVGALKFKVERLRKALTDIAALAEQHEDPAIYNLAMAVLKREK